MNGVPKPIDAKEETDAAPQIVAGMTVGSDLLKKNDEAAKIDAVGCGGVG